MGIYINAFVVNIPGLGGNNMACEICGRSNCMRSFHSLEEQKHYNQYADMDTAELINECIDKDNKLDALEEQIEKLEAFAENVSPLLRRLQEPRYDKYETNDYICNSGDCKRALKAMAELDAWLFEDKKYPSIAEALEERRVK